MDNAVRHKDCFSFREEGEVMVAYSARSASRAVSVLMLCLSALAWAGAPSIQPLLKITRSDDPGFRADILLKKDGDGNLVSMSSSGGKPITLRQLQQGFVMHREKGVEVIRITADKNFSVNSGGVLVIRYLKHFYLSPFKDKEFGEFRMDLVREGDQWMLRDEHHQNFEQILMTPAEYGIKSIVPINVSSAPQIQQVVGEHAPQDHLNQQGVSDTRFEHQKSFTPESSTGSVSGESSRSAQSFSAK